MDTRSVLGGVFILAAAFSACRAGGLGPSGDQTAGAAGGGACAASGGEPGIVPITDSGTSSAVVLARWSGRDVALVADEDNRSLHAIDVQRRSELGTTPLAGTPSQVLVAPDGRVLVALRDVSRIQVLEPTRGAEGTLATRCTISAPADPVSIAEAPNHESFAVVSAWGHAITLLRASDLAVKRSIDLPREPRGVAFASDSARVFVSHALGAGMSVVDPSTGAVRPVDASGPVEVRALTPRSGVEAKVFRRSSGQGFALAKVAGAIVVPHVLIDPGERGEPTENYYGGGPAAEIADVLVVDEQSERPFDSALPRSNRRVVPLATTELAGPETGGSAADSSKATCLLPRGIATRPGEGTVLVTCLGSDMLVEYAVDAANGSRRAVPRRHWSVGSGPVGVAYDPSGQAIVWSQFDGAVSFVPLPSGSMEDRTMRGPAHVAELTLARRARLDEDIDLGLGRKVYHSAGNRALSSDGRACESCHPDGRDDGVTWQTPEGPRQTVMLAGRLDRTAPYGWNGQSADLASHIRETIHNLRGSGLGDRELAAVVAYCRAMKGPPPEQLGADAMIARGRAIFESPQAACAQCHTSAGGAPLTDGIGHDVLSEAPSDANGVFDTPSLRSVGGTAPYFHDGRYATLGALLEGVDGTMGHTAQLSPEDRTALQAYLRSL
jgi:mono/diheme cytochrome c family protein/DNA-binding beta-propeller fold protein YncE